MAERERNTPRWRNYYQRGERRQECGNWFGSKRSDVEQTTVITKKSNNKREQYNKLVHHLKKKHVVHNNEGQKSCEESLTATVIFQYLSSRISTSHKYPEISPSTTVSPRFVLGFILMLLTSNNVMQFIILL